MAMATAGEYAAMVAGLRFIRRTARRLARLPDRQLRVSDEDAADAEYVNECLGIVLRMAGVKMEGSIPSCWEDFDAAQHYRQCMGLASRQAGRLLLGLRLGRIRKNMVTHNAWYNVDSAETHLRDLASCGVKRKGVAWMVFPKKEVVEAVRARYPVGTRVALVSMADPYSRLKPGDTGTVSHVDDTGTVFVSWDCGSGLGVVYGEDKIRILEGGDFE